MRFISAPGRFLTRVFSFFAGRSGALFGAGAVRTGRVFGQEPRSVFSLASFIARLR